MQQKYQNDQQSHVETQTTNVPPTAVDEPQSLMHQQRLKTQSLITLPQLQNLIADKNQKPPKTQAEKLGINDRSVWKPGRT